MKCFLMQTLRWRKHGLNKNKNMKTFSQFMEAAGDPIKPEQVIPMDAETQRNLQKAMMRPTSAVKPAPKPDKIKNFVRRSMNNTLLTPL